MFTLTYNERCLPWFHNSEYNIHIPVFNRDDVKRFKKNFFREIRRLYPDHKDKITTFITCEYGKHRSCRSHYHGNFYIYGLDLKTKPERFWRSLLQRCWRTKLKDKKLSKDRIKNTKLLGNVSCSKKYGYVVQNPKGAVYACKYVTKDIVFYQDPLLQEALKHYDFRKSIKPYLPFHHQSMHFGETLVNILKMEANFDHLVNGKYPILNTQNKLYEYKIPRYLIHKTMYERNEHGLLQLNDLGKRVKEQQIKSILQKTKDYLSECFNHDYINRFWATYKPQHDLIFPHRINDTTPDKFIKTLNYILGSRSLDDLAYYYLVFRDMPFRSIDADFGYNQHADDITFFSQLAETILYDRIMTYGLPEKESYFKINPGHLMYYQRNTFNHFPCFKGFDHIINQINLFHSCINSLSEAAKVKDAEEVRDRRERHYNKQYNNE